jgi:hypothetical protein
MDAADPVESIDRSTDLAGDMGNLRGVLLGVLCLNTCDTLDGVTSGWASSGSCHTSASTAGLNDLEPVGGEIAGFFAGTLVGAGSAF